LAAARNLVSRFIAGSGRYTKVGLELDRGVPGVLGLGRIGTRVARIGAAFGMDVVDVAWSQNLTAEGAAEAGCATHRESSFPRQRTRRPCTSSRANASLA